MSDWNEYKIKELVRKEANSFIDGDWIEAPYITDRGIRLIQTGNIGVGLFVNKNKKYISENSFNSLRCKEIFPGDLLICRLADPIGRGCIVPDLKERYITSVDVAILRIDEDHFEKNLIIQVINNDEFLAKCNEVSGGSTRQRISRKNLGEIGVLLPRIKEQRKIAKILTTVDNLIEKTQALIDKYQSIKQGMMHDLFTRGVDQNGKLRPTYEEAPHLYKESELGWIPKEWEIRRLGNFTCVKGGKRLPAGSDFANEKTEYPYLRVTDMVNGTIKDGDIKHVSAEIQKSISRYTISSDDLYVTIAGTIGLFGTIPLKYDGAQLTENAAKITSIDPNKYDLLYLSALLNSKIISSQVLKEIGLGAGVPKLALFRIEKLLLPIPTLNEQKRNRLRLQKIINTIEIEGKKLEKLKSLKNGLMQDLLTGKVRVKTDEVEEEVS